MELVLACCKIALLDGQGCSKLGKLIVEVCQNPLASVLLWWHHASSLHVQYEVLIWNSRNRGWYLKMTKVRMDKCHKFNGNDGLNGVLIFAAMA